MAERPVKPRGLGYAKLNSSKSKSGGSRSPYRWYSKMPKRAVELLGDRAPSRSLVLIERPFLEVRETRGEER